jgi:hypothetical protein
MSAKEAPLQWTTRLSLHVERPALDRARSKPPRPTGSVSLAAVDVEDMAGDE